MMLHRKAHTLGYVLCCWILCCSPSVYAQGDDWAAPLQAGQQALSEQRYADAYPVYLKYANQGNGLAQFNLALFHQLGWARAVDQQQACDWFVRAAQNNIPAALSAAGDCVIDGRVKDANPQAAFDFYMQAFEQNLLSAGCSAGQLLIDGTLGENRQAEGLSLCKQAAELGSTDAALKVAKWYFHGQYTRPNYPLALDMFQRARPEQQPEAAFYIARYFDQGLHIQQDFQQAAYWYEVAAQEGWQAAYLPCAALYWSLFNSAADNKAVFLAKAYMWGKASMSIAQDAQRNQAQALVAAVERAMPPTWQQDLDHKVQEHLQQVSQTTSAADQRP